MVMVMVDAVGAEFTLALDQVPETVATPPRATIAAVPREYDRGKHLPRI
jgi:hypothetical protein